MFCIESHSLRPTGESSLFLPVDTVLSLYPFLHIRCYWIQCGWKQRSGTYVGKLVHRPPGARLIKLYTLNLISLWRRSPVVTFRRTAEGFSWASIIKANFKSKRGRGMEKHSRFSPTNQGDLSDWSYRGSINPLHYWVINMCWAPALLWCSAAAAAPLLFTQTQSFLTIGKKSLKQIKLHRLTAV